MQDAETGTSYANAEKAVDTDHGGTAAQDPRGLPNVSDIHAGRSNPQQPT